MNCSIKKKHARTETVIKYFIDETQKKTRYSEPKWARMMGWNDGGLGAVMSRYNFEEHSERKIETSWSRRARGR